MAGAHVGGVRGVAVAFVVAQAAGFMAISYRCLRHYKHADWRELVPRLGEALTLVKKIKDAGWAVWRARRVGSA